jgi:hypothetical protein
MPDFLIKKIISGGQTGVDRAALDIAIKLDIPYGGWCPAERWAEDAPIPMNYQNMTETPSSAPEERTEWNARDSDGTLIIVKEAPIGGTLYTIEMAKKHQKPYLVFNVSAEQKVDEIAEWIKTNSIQKLNVAGPRASQSTGIYNIAADLLEQMLNHTLINQHEDNTVHSVEPSRISLNR